MRKLVEILIIISAIIILAVSYVYSQETISSSGNQYFGTIMCIDETKYIIKFNTLQIYQGAYVFKSNNGMVDVFSMDNVYTIGYRVLTTELDSLYKKEKTTQKTAVKKEVKALEYRLEGNHD